MGVWWNLTTLPPRVSTQRQSPVSARLARLALDPYRDTLARLYWEPLGLFVSTRRQQMEL